MPLLRLILIAANAALFAWVSYLFFGKSTGSMNTSDLAFGWALLAGLGLNFFYLLASTQRKFNFRIFRLIGLWFDAKESELRRRANQNEK